MPAPVSQSACPKAPVPSAAGPQPEARSRDLTSQSGPLMVAPATPLRQKLALVRGVALGLQSPVPTSVRGFPQDTGREQ